MGSDAVNWCKNINPCKSGIVEGIRADQSGAEENKAFRATVGKHSNIKIVAIAAGGYLAAPALTATQNVLSAHPDINVIVSSGDQMIAGAVKAAQAAGLAGKIKMYGNGCTFEAKVLIQHGKQTGCTVYLPRTEGRLVVQALVDAVNGKGKSGVSIDPTPRSPIGGLGTKANIGKFTPEFHS